MKQILFSLVVFVNLNLIAQNDSVFIRKIYDEALSNGQSYENLRSLCKDVGNRLSGSTGAKMAVGWAKHLLESYDFDTVYLQDIMVPHWERGTAEKAWVKSDDGKITRINILALGGSIGTDGTIEGQIVEFKTLNALKNASRSQVEGKIVFVNQPMNEKHINTLRAYGEAYPVRGHSAVLGAKLGAKAVIIRSLGLPVNDFPHTGTMRYEDSIKKIPAAAISTLDANFLSELLKNKSVQFVMEMDCKWYEPVPSHNVIAAIKGTKYPNQIITIGGHLDSWDVGEGAHDDGAGVVHSIEALRILKKLNYHPKHTLRVVLFMNEENGNMGGKTYAKWVKKNGEKHIAAIESDLGGFVPRGFDCDCPEKSVQQLKSFAPILKPYQLHLLKKGHAGVDTYPLKENYPNIALYSFSPDSQRYFDIHHCENDVFENVNKRELELGCAAIAALTYLIDNQQYNY